MKKRPPNKTPRVPSESIQFCLNCNDMDDLATSEEGKDLEGIRKRFQNCEHTGRFEGDLCSRMFVVHDDIENEYFVEDDDED